MTALVQACDVAQSVDNTGIECDSSFGLLAMVLAAPTAFRFDEADAADIETAVDAAISADRGARIFPMFGNAAPLGSVVNNNEADVTETLPNGQVVYIRPGFINFDVFTLKGGLCYYEHLKSFIGAGYGAFLIDVDGKMLAKKYIATNGDISYGPLNVTLTARSPSFTTDTTVYKNNFTVAVNPSDLTGATILSGAANLLGVTGLIDVDLSQTAAASTTIIKVGAHTACAHTNMYGLYAAGLSDVDAWVVTDEAGATVTLSSVTQDATNSGWNLNGTFVSGDDYTVDLATPANLRTNTTVEGYESTGSITVTIP